VASRVTAEVRDYRDLAALGTFDAVASVGMFEHVGAANLEAYFRAAAAALVPEGRFLNHGIARAQQPAGGPRPRPGSKSSHFIGRYVFPDGELVPLETATAVARYRVGFDVIDVALLRPHYALTLAAWVSRLEASWDAAVAAAGEEVARTWRLYMSAARLGFERGELEVAQLLLAKSVDGRPVERPLRPWW
jgi:cyclopropane-fatty-acyl-phospholipid synthase